MVKLNYVDKLSCTFFNLGIKIPLICLKQFLLANKTYTHTQHVHKHAKLYYKKI